MNLLMTAPLLDSRGNLRYFIGAQIDVTGLVKDGTDLEAWQRMRERQQSGEPQEEPKDEFQELSKMFNNSELDIVRKHGGNMHREVSDQDDASTIHHRPRVLIQDQSTFDSPQEDHKPNPKIDGRLSGPYKHVSWPSYSAVSDYTNHSTVSTSPTRPFAPYSFLLAIPSRSWNSAIAVPRTHRRQRPRPRFGR
jgi:hypothetical protein